MNRLMTRISISIGVAFVFAAASFVFVYTVIDIFAPEVPADVHSILALSAAITTSAIVATLTFVALRHIANMVKARRSTRPHSDR